MAVLGHDAIAHPRPSLRRSILQDKETRDENGTMHDGNVCFSNTADRLLFTFIAEESDPLLSESPSVEEEKRDRPVIFAFKGLKPLKYKEWRREGIVWKILDVCKVCVQYNQHQGYVTSQRGSTGPHSILASIDRPCG